MQRFVSFCIILFILAAGTASHAAAPAPKAMMPKVLALGADTPALLLADDSLPMVTLQLTFLYAGGVSDTPNTAGRAMLAARMLREGAGESDAAAFRTRLEERAILLRTQVDSDNLTVSLKTLREHLPEAIALLTQMLTAPRFDDSALTLMRHEMLAELRYAGQDPGWVASRLWAKTAYSLPPLPSGEVSEQSELGEGKNKETPSPDSPASSAGSSTSPIGRGIMPQHPYALSLQGTRKTLEALEADDLRDWHRDFLTRDRLRVAAVGDTDAATLSALLAPLLKALPEKSTQSLPPQAAPLPEIAQPVVQHKDVPQSVVIFGYPALPRHDPDFYAAYLLNHILGGGTLVSRLALTLREEKGLVYSVNSHLSQAAFSPVLMGNFATQNATTPQALAALQQVLQRLAKEGVTATEIKNAQDYLTGSFPLELDSQSARAGYLTSMLIYRLGNDYLQRRNDYFRKVTPAQVTRAAKRLLSRPPLIIVVGKGVDGLR